MAPISRYLPETPSQTAGPFVHIGLAPGVAGLGDTVRALGTDIAGPNAAGERIRVEGRIIDGTGTPVRDALLEIWQANAQGDYAQPGGGGRVEEGFCGFGRVATDFSSGAWGFGTIKPGATHEPRLGRQAPHLTLYILARGINIGLHTRLYFGDEAEANADDPVLRLIEWEARRSTLIAQRSERDGVPLYRFDIVLQGDHETVFFDI